MEKSAFSSWEIPSWQSSTKFCIPTVISFWRKYQKKILDTLNGKEVVLAEDGRHDSMGHSTKYGTYTIFCCTVGLIIHIVLVQASDASLVNPH